jgi:hypothetical protein
VRLSAPVILLVASISLTGCGSSSGSSSKAEFIAKADALCEASKAKQEPLRGNLEATARKARREQEGGGEVSEQTRVELAQTLRRIVTMAEASLSQVQGLGSPEADRDQLETIFQETESAFETSRAYSAALEDHEDAKAQAIAEEGKRPDARNRRLGQAVRLQGLRLPAVGTRLGNVGAFQSQVEGRCKYRTASGGDAGPRRRDR